MNSIFALVLIFNTAPMEGTEEAWRGNLTFEQCDNAQREIWSQDWRIVGYDESGALFEVDAYCVEMERLETAEFSNVIRIDKRG